MPSEPEELPLAHPVHGTAHLARRLLRNQTSIRANFVEAVYVRLADVGHGPQVKVGPQKGLLRGLKAANNLGACRDAVAASLIEGGSLPDREVLKIAPAHKKRVLD